MARKFLDWCLIKNAGIGLWSNGRHVTNARSAALQSTQTLVEHVINMTQQPVPLTSHLPFTVPRNTIIYGFPKIGFTYQELAAATNGFATGNCIGEGAFGPVYKGKLQDGRIVAIKRLSPSSTQGQKEVFAELDLLSRVHHRHLVQLIGCSVTKRKSLLVYEYVPQGSLDVHIHWKSSKTIDWPTRVKVALGSAKALAYLHESCQPRIIHRDIKPTNILIDEYFRPKVADFGIAKFLPDGVTGIETRVMGTYGWISLHI
ncbi:Proline-rich receptor-like protein kinase PERK4 [Rhynchospora pubera]|uniref:non-specific serine/threonine protein kinase n=1 Tax=Rhynchospora pubera TaxID=906938 RepID=A0AAV8DH60_9POAL|nr:Proline-rich receptor-like protein kinase PERK4 [Rhynchospora pubera]